MKRVLSAAGSAHIRWEALAVVSCTSGEKNHLEIGTLNISQFS